MQGRGKRPLRYKADGIEDLLSELRRGSNRHEPYVAIAQRAGLAPSTVSKLDRGVTRHPRFETMTSLARAVGCRYILTREE
jgi:hypothetical protein